MSLDERLAQRQREQDDLHRRLKAEYGGSIPPKAEEKVWQKAWDDGHAHGETEVEWKYVDLIDIAREAMKGDETDNELGSIVWVRFANYTLGGLDGISAMTRALSDFGLRRGPAEEVSTPLQLGKLPVGSVVLSGKTAWQSHQAGRLDTASRKKVVEVCWTSGSRTLSLGRAASTILPARVLHRGGQ